MALWDSKKTHCSPSFVSNGNRKICYGQLKYWTSVKKRRNWTKLLEKIFKSNICAAATPVFISKMVFFLFCEIFILRLDLVSCSGESNNGDTMGSWHSALFAKPTQNHQTSPFSSTTVVPGLLIIPQIHCFLEQKNTREIWYKKFTTIRWISFKCNDKAASICSY